MIDPGSPEPIRIDIWLWAARFYKTRNLAAEAVTAGHVSVNGQRCKRAKGVKPGDVVSMNRGGEQTEVTVMQTSTRRGPAPLAQTLYQETPESRARAEIMRALRTMTAAQASTPGSRPTKRERRALDRWSRQES
jgi:ribosome-associated heat shock protein Hsp15